MKKMFRTTIFRFALIFLFRSYLRLFNRPLGAQVGALFGKSQQTCGTDTVTNAISDQLQGIQNQLDVINQRIQTKSESVSQDSLFSTTASTKVALYYFNQTVDQKLPSEQQVNINSILPVYRIFPASKNLLVDAINELIKGNLTSAEKQQGFITEFPNHDFKLISADLSDDGNLTLQFTEVPGFTDGGSARMLILWNGIEKTAHQFPGVKKVVFTPETLFQP